MNYQISHITKYNYSEAVGLCHNEARLQPRDCSWQRVLSHELIIKPEPSVRGERTDYFGNQTTWFSFNEGYRSLNVTATSQVQLQSRSAPVSTQPWKDVEHLIKTSDNGEFVRASQFVHPSPRVIWDGELKDYVIPSFSPARPLHESLADLLARIDNDFEFDATATTVNSSVAEVFRKRRGVCQDFAHLVIAMLRSLGLSSRYVSGYIRTHPPAGQPRRVGVDASHAWVSVFAGDAGWVDIDPTNNSFVDLEHVTLAWGRDYSDVCPVKGVLIGGGHHVLDVSVDVCPVETNSAPSSS